MYNFSFHRPHDLASAEGYLKADEAKLLAGGQTLIPTLKQRLASPKHLIDLSSLAGLTGIERQGRSVVIGAMTRHAEVAGRADPGVSQPLPPAGLHTLSPCLPP